MSNQWQDQGIILSARPHAETGAIVSVLTAEHGRCNGYVHGAISNRKRAMLEQGTLVSVEWRARQADQLGSFALEIEKSFAADIMFDATRLAALQAACALADKTLAERETHAGVFEGMKALLESFAGEVWPAAYIYWELGLLRELGFGIDLSQCAVTGMQGDLCYVSPRSGRAVSLDAAEPYKDKLLPLPGFLQGGSDLSSPEILKGLQMTGYFLLNRVFAQSNANLPEARLRLEQKFS